jgi:Protein of unknown function (DUF3565)
LPESTPKTNEVHHHLVLAHGQLGLLHHAASTRPPDYSMADQCTHIVLESGIPIQLRASPSIIKPPMSVLRKIISFHQDVQGHWVADLACGHTQHVRHDPPWSLREWVLTPEGRTSYLGRELPCKKCETDLPQQ